MKSEEMYKYAKMVVDDEGTFSVDQITTLQNLCDVLRDAVALQIKESLVKARLIKVIVPDDTHCTYCDGYGRIETDNNGPIVNCPVCK